MFMRMLALARAARPRRIHVPDVQLAAANSVYHYYMAVVWSLVCLQVFERDVQCLLNFDDIGNTYFS